MNKKILISLFTIVILSCSIAQAKRQHNEKYYQEKYCKGIIEYRLPDNTRVDCLTDEYAIEYDFAAKQYEALAQALHYARLTGKKAGVALIIEKPTDIRYYNRLMNNIEFYELPITVWKIKGE